ncbi:MAG: hypothetical protein ACR2PB_13170 [Desulfocapsaceae bacterium]
MITIRPLNLSLLLGVIAIILALASLLSVYLGTVTIENQSFVNLRNIYIRLFDLNREANIPTWFSSILLVLNAFILAIIAIRTKAEQGSYYTQWFVLAAIFLYLSIDESALLHEMTEKPVRRVLHVSGYLYFAWIIPAVGCLLVLGLYIRRFLFALPKKTRWLFLIAGAVFVTGAVGMEAMGSKIFSTTGGQKTMAYILFANLEESLEMLGLIIFFYALLAYVAEHMPEIVFSVEKRGAGSAHGD